MHRTIERPLARLLPIADATLEPAGLRVVMRQQFGFRLGDCRELSLQSLGDTGMKASTLAFQQAFVCRLLHQGVLEDVCRFRRLS